jgi:hypothetical protein
MLMVCVFMPIRPSMLQAWLPESVLPDAESRGSTNVRRSLSEQAGVGTSTASPVPEEVDVERRHSQVASFLFFFLSYKK